MSQTMNKPEQTKTTVRHLGIEYTVTYEGSQAICIQSHLLGTIQWRYGQPKDALDVEIIQEAEKVRQWLAAAAPAKKIVHLRRIDSYNFEHNTDGKGWQKVLGYVHVFRQDVLRSGMHLIEE